MCFAAGLNPREDLAFGGSCDVRSASMKMVLQYSSLGLFNEL